MKKDIFILLSVLTVSILFIGCKQEIASKVKLTGISISKFPTKLFYECEDILDLTGLEITADYSDGYAEVLGDTEYKTNPVSGTVLNTVGKQSIKIIYQNYSAIFSVDVTKKKMSDVICDSFFWGKWIRMDNGTTYDVFESYIRSEDSSYSIESVSESAIVVDTLGVFTKKSDSVLVCNNIPYFRDGGVELNYSLKIVGFTNQSRSVGTSLSGIRGKSKSDRYTSFEDESESDDDGTITFKAPTAGDVQTVTIENGDDILVIPGLEIKNDGDYMGTVAIVGESDYNLKITGTISDDQKDDGYLYGNNAKTYDLTITITNISSNICKASVCEIIPDDLGMNLTTSTGFSSFPISTLKPGATKVLNCKVSYGDLTDPYIDTGISINITNSTTEQKWIDFIPLRFYKGLIPITVAAKSPEENDEAALNGFIVYPDGNSQFFSIENDSSGILFVPTFGSNKRYMMVFSGATVSSELSESTEMFYSVSVASCKKRNIITYSDDASELLDYMNFGGDNHTEERSYDVDNSFQAYLSEGEIDYYSIVADGDEVYAPGEKSFCQVNYESEYDLVPISFLIPEGAFLSSDKLPVLEYENMVFIGWYVGAVRVEPDNYIVTGDVTLTAKWKPSTDQEDGFVFVEGAIVEGNSNPSTEFVGAFPTGRKVGISDFYMSPYEVTKKLYYEVMKDNPLGVVSDPAWTSASPAIYVLNGGESDRERAIEGMTWYEAVYFCNRYSELCNLEPVYEISDIQLNDYNQIVSATVTADNTKEGYRLPTEAEWEYAARGGIMSYGFSAFDFCYSGQTTAIFSVATCSDLDGYGWYKYNTCNGGITYSEEPRAETQGYGTHQVGLLLPNCLGLYDMSGNVWELCYDWCDTIEAEDVNNPEGPITGETKVTKGGSWICDANYCLVMTRAGNNPGEDFIDVGFRLVRSVPKQKYSITYSSEHGVVPDEKIVQGKVLSKTYLPELSESGWIFLGWYTDNSFSWSTEINVGDEIKSDITLYAKWKQATGPDDGFIYIESGTFSMSSVYSGDSPIHTVTLTRNFYISPYELTQSEYRKYCTYGGAWPNPNHYGNGDDYPVYFVSWYDAIVYCNKRSIAEGLTPCYTINDSTNPYDWGDIPADYDSLWNSAVCDFDADGYRLPTEAEWEFVARGGRKNCGYKYSGSDDVNEVAWYDENSDSLVHEVGQKKPNKLGIYDMSGNVGEWCWDGYGSYPSSEQIDPTGNSLSANRIVRGGYCLLDDDFCLVYYRNGCSENYRHNTKSYGMDGINGFRLVRTSL